MKGEVTGIATFQMIEEQNLNFAISSERIAKLNPGRGEAFGKSKDFTETLDSAEMFSLIGFSFICNEEYERAISYFEKAKEKNPQYAVAYFFRALL